MLTIRPEQMLVFEREGWRRLASQAVDHLRTYFPEQCAALGESDLLAKIDAGIRHARAHGLETTCDFLRYLNLAIVFGWDFDRRCSWAQEILSNAEFGPHTRTDLLSQKALDELHWVGEVPEELEKGQPVEEEAIEFEGLKDEEPGDSMDASVPEPLQWESEGPLPIGELDPNVDYTAHELDFHDGE